MSLDIIMETGTYTGNGATQSISIARGVELGGDTISVVVDGQSVTLPKSAEIEIPSTEPAPGTQKTSEKLNDSARLVETPPVVLSFLNKNLVVMNEVTEQELSHYVLLQTVPDVFAERELGIKDQFVTTIAFQDRFGRADSNDNLNVFLQLSHTNDKVNSMRGIQLGGDSIVVVVNDINQGLITMTTEVDGINQS